MQNEVNFRGSISSGKSGSVYAEIPHYNANRSSFIYENEVNIQIQIQIDQGDTKRTKGGFSSKNQELLPYLAVEEPKLVPDSYWASPNP